MYLGDGYINEMKRTHRLRISLDKKYNNIINETIHNLNVLFKQNSVNVINKKGEWVEISVYSNSLNSLFPNGKGKKHLRKITLTDFQKNNINHEFLLRGLFHSDGCFYKSDKYYYYNFTNKSKDIIDIFINCLNNIGVEYKLNYNTKSDIYKVNIYKKKDVIKLYTILGVKNEKILKEVKNYMSS